MDLHFNQSLANGYHSGSQISRVLTEDWMEHNMFCPVCGAPVLGHYQANKPVADFFCDDCKSDFELKSKESKTAVIGHKIADGAYGTMIERITSLRNPHLFELTRCLSPCEVECSTTKASTVEERDTPLSLLNDNEIEIWGLCPHFPDIYKL